MNDAGNIAPWLQESYRRWDFIALIGLGLGVILKMLLLPRPTSVVGVLLWLLSAISGGIAICLYILAALGTLSMGIMFYLSTRLNGFPSLSICRAMLEVRSIGINTPGSHFPFRSWKHPFRFLALSLFLIAGWALFGVEILLGLSVITIADLSWGLLNDVTPPTVLLLASSSPESVALQAGSLKAMPGYRIISLLDLVVMPHAATEGAFYASRSDSQVVQSFVGGDVLRLPSEHPWEGTVRALMGLVPIIAVDTRIRSNGVVSEIQWIRNTDTLLNKTVFIVAENGDHPAFDDLERDHGSSGVDVAHRMLRPGDFLGLLKTVAESKNVAALFHELSRAQEACKSAIAAGVHGMARFTQDEKHGQQPAAGDADKPRA